jgi:selenocysteine lyase/cysteine desulfurase
LSLSQVPADFVAISFYKMFGYPTGIGALVARHESLTMLRRTYFAGGTVQFASVQNRLVRYRPGGGGFEDGTPNFLAMPAVCDGLNWLQNIEMDRVQQHVDAMTECVLNRCAGFGDRIVLHGPRNIEDRGGTVALSLYRDGKLLPFEMVEAAARNFGIAIRGGCFCNPGAAEGAFAIPAGRARRCLQGDFSVAEYRRCMEGRAVGAVRVSVGIATTRYDIAALFDFIEAITDSGSSISAATIGE